MQNCHMKKCERGPSVYPIAGYTNSRCTQNLDESIAKTKSEFAFGKTMMSLGYISKNLSRIHL